jgi:hypothetical protein
MSEICPVCGVGLWEWYNCYDCPNCHYSTEEDDENYGWGDMTVSDINWAMSKNRIYYWVHGKRLADEMSYKEQQEFEEQVWIKEEFENIEWDDE